MAYAERYVRADAAGSGDGTTDTNSGANGAWTYYEALAITTGGIRFNVKSGVGTYTLGANAVMGNATTENPHLWQGFVNTPGDLENLGRSSATGPLVTTGFPTIDCGSSYGITMGAFNTIRNVIVTGSRSSSTGLLASSSNLACAVDRCLISNTGSGGNNCALVFGATYGSITNCDFSVASTSSSLISVDIGRTITSGCRLWHTGSPNAAAKGFLADTFGAALINCIIYNIGVAITTGANTVSIFGNSIYSCVDGIVLGNCGPLIYGNVFDTVTGYLFKGATSSGNPQLMKNASTTPTSGRIDTTGAGSIITELDAIALSGSPFTNAAAGDFTLNNTAGAGASCRAASLFWGGYADLGAVQHQDAGGSSERSFASIG